MPTAWSWLVSLGTWAQAHQSLMLVAAGIIIGIEGLRALLAFVRRGRG
jgi:hypothetical protein